jgi:hypothetical protein
MIVESSKEESIKNPFVLLVSDPLSETTRNQRRSLLALSGTSLVVLIYGTTPTGVSALGITGLIYADNIPAKTPAAEPIPIPEDAVEALGLKLEKAERPYPTIVVESAEREPTAN